MSYELIVPVRCEPDNLPIIGLSSLHLTHSEHKALTEDVAFNLLRAQGYNVIRMTQRDENIISINFKERF